jgi:hypothetical protein
MKKTKVHTGEMPNLRSIPANPARNSTRFSCIPFGLSNSTLKCEGGIWRHSPFTTPRVGHFRHKARRTVALRLLLLIGIINFVLFKSHFPLKKIVVRGGGFGATRLSLQLGSAIHYYSSYSSE